MAVTEENMVAGPDAVIVRGVIMVVRMTVVMAVMMIVKRVVVCHRHAVYAGRGKIARRMRPAPAGTGWR